MTSQRVEAPSTPSSSSSDAAVAIRNGLRLGASLLATWTVALVVRFQLPRHLGPETFGRFNFCDAFTGGVFSFLGLGVTTYIMKEISVRPQHASDFFGGLLVVRAALGVVATGVLLVIFHVSDYSLAVKALMVVFACCHFVIGINLYLGAILQASTKVKALASVNVVSKLLWGVGLMLALFMDAPLYALGLPALAAELLRLAALVPAARRAVGLTFRVDLRATKTVILASLPFFANAIALELGFRIDVSMLEFLTPGPEVGWYSAANGFAGLALILSPVLGWVVMPLLARAHTRSHDELYQIVRTAIRGLLIAAIPGALLIAIGADVLVEVAFGASFLPATNAVRILAPMFVATYLAILLSMTLVVLQRSWTLTTVSFVAVAVEPLIILLAIWILKGRGEGAIASAAAIGLAGSEVITVCLLFYAVGRRAMDVPTATAIGKSLALCAAVVVLHRALVGLGPWRLLLDMLAYALGAILTGTVRISEAVALFGMLRERKRGAAS